MEQIREQHANPGPDPRVINYAKEWMNANPWYDPSGRDEDSAITKVIDNQLAAALRGDVNAALLAAQSKDPERIANVRKAVEEHAQLLMREINHRSKNLLAVVQSIAHQMARGSDPATFAEVLIVTCRRRGVPPPDINADELAAVRTALREFGAAWRPLNPGQSVERTF